MKNMKIMKYFLHPIDVIVDLSGFTLAKVFENTLF